MALHSTLNQICSGSLVMGTHLMHGLFMIEIKLPTRVAIALIASLGAENAFCLQE